MTPRVMPKRVGSIRNIILLSTLVVAVIGLVVSYFIAFIIEQRAQISTAKNDLQAFVSTAYDALQGPDYQRQLSLLTEANSNLGITVFKGDKRIYISLSDTLHGRKVSESVTRAPYTVRAYLVVEDLAPISVEVTAIAGALSILIIVAGMISGSILTRSLRRPVNEVVEAAEKIAAGDLSARISPSGPEEITKLAVAFDFMAQHLEEAEETKRRFLSDLAHEIATPLNSISGFALALADGTVEGPSERQEVAEIITTETSRIRGLLTDLRNLDTLDLSYPSKVTPVNLREYLEALAHRFGPQAKEKEVVLKVDASRIRINVDERLLDLVISNFVTNAIRYVDRGGHVTITARDAPHHEVSIAVKDDGIGIAPEHLALIFDRLFRVDEARDRVSGGSGLGLSIAQRAALNMHGRIEVASAPGKGSEFKLFIPANREALRRRPPTATATVVADE